MPTTHRTASDGTPDRTIEQQLVDLLTRLQAEGATPEDRIEQINMLSATALPTIQTPLHTVYESEESPPQEEADAASAPTPVTITNPGDLQEPADGLHAHMGACPLPAPDTMRQEAPYAGPSQLLLSNTTSNPPPTPSNPLQSEADGHSVLEEPPPTTEVPADPAPQPVSPTDPGALQEPADALQALSPR